MKDGELRTVPQWQPHFNCRAGTLHKPRNLSLLEEKGYRGNAKAPGNPAGQVLQ
jgi:hypothetical protein